MASAAAAVTSPLCTLSFPPKRNREPSPFKWNPLRFKIRPSAPPSLHCVPLNSRPVVALSSSSSPSSPSSSSSSSLHRSSPTLIQRKEFINEQGDVAEGVLVKILKAIKKPLVAVVLVGFLLLHDPFAALAASGGRMGGRSFSSSSPSVSRSYSGGSNSFSLRSTPFSFGGGGLYYGPTFGIGVGAGSGFFFLMMGFAAFILLSGFLSDRTDDGSVLSATQKTTVIKLQVGLLGMARSFQKDLDRIAEVADTSTSQGLSYVLTETTLALLRHPDCCISGYSYVDVKKNIEDGEKRFNSLSIEERGKFGEETLVNVNSIKRQSTKMQRSKGFRNEYIVITILVAAEGVHKLPSINGSSDLKDALQKLGSIHASKTLAVEVLWTPQEEDDTLTERELVADYPLLRPL